MLNELYMRCSILINRYIRGYLSRARTRRYINAKLLHKHNLLPLSFHHVNYVETEPNEMRLHKGGGSWMWLAKPKRNPKLHATGAWLYPHPAVVTIQSTLRTVRALQRLEPLRELDQKAKSLASLWGMGLLRRARKRIRTTRRMQLWWKSLSNKWKFQAAVSNAAKLAFVQACGACARRTTQFSISSDFKETDQSHI